MHAEMARVLVCTFLISGVLSCSKAQESKTAAGSPAPVTAKTNSAVKQIESMAQFKSLVDSAGSQLLMFDLYADWCAPCRRLSPMLEKIAADSRGSVSVYKINVDRHPDIASMFQVSGIPYVVFVKNKQAVQALTGLQPEDAYRRVIAQHGAKDTTVTTSTGDHPDGNLVGGVRVITLSTATTVGNLYVYRGEEVRLVFDKVDFPFSVHVPALGASASAVAGETLKVEFKAKESGVYPMMCNGKCPSGDGQQYARIVVMEFEGAADKKAIFKSISPKAASEMLAKENPLLLDVRTPNEFFAERIPGAKLIPVQQLADRLEEISAWRNQPIVVYCRSGNRSIPASQILIRNGFTKVYNMQQGIGGWVRQQLPVQKG